MTFLIVLEGTANEIPANSPVELNTAILIPMTSPLRFNRGPPELPSLIGTSVTITSAIENVVLDVSSSTPSSAPSVSSSDGMSAPNLPITPSVKTPDRPNGFPIAATGSPTLNSVEFPIDNGISLSLGTSGADKTARLKNNRFPLTWHYRYFHPK